MTASTLEKATWVIALLILIPVLLIPSVWPVALALAVIWIVAVYGLKYLLDLEKHRRTGERMDIAEVRNTVNREDDP